MIEVEDLSKAYRGKSVVENLSFHVRPGQVTGLLGPNGAGKTTTLHCILGLTAPSSGECRILGKPYHRISRPLEHVGAVLDALAKHPNRRGRDHLLWLAQSNGLPRGRVDETIELVGLTSVAHKRVGRYSLGMSQRLSIAAALLGNPEVLMLDEPTNGLDPDGVLWVRGMLRSLSAEGRTVLLSSHLMSEMQSIADHVILLGKGKLIADSPIEALLRSPTRRVYVRSPNATRLAQALANSGLTIESESRGALVVTGAYSSIVGDIAYTAGIPIHELSPRRWSLEDAYITLTRDSVEFGTLNQGVSDE